MHVEGETLCPAGLPPVGTVVGGKYRVERYIAEGGMGVIAVARHVDLDEPVALKFLKPDVVSPDPSGTIASRFVREARATIKIRSEHVPRIFDVTTLDIGVPYIVMELLVGEDLDARLERQGPLPVAFVIDMILQSLEAVAAAHALGIVHRDFKPANLFLAKRLDGSDCVKVLDFGIAKLVDHSGTGRDQGLTGTHAVMGSPRYMSPEQMRSTRDVDGRADIWAVGTTIYELLTGAAPFDGESLMEVCAAILQDEPSPMTVRRHDLPVGLEDVVRRCLAKQPDARFATVAELASALAPFGTAPAAYEMAARVERVLGSGLAARPSSPSFVPAAAQSGVTAPRQRLASQAGVTNTSWDAKSSSAHAGRRRGWVIATVLAALFLAGSGAVLGGVALFRSRPSRDATSSAAGPSPQPTAASAASAASEPAAAATAAPSPPAPTPSATLATPSPSSPPMLVSPPSHSPAATEKPRPKVSLDPKPPSSPAAPSKPSTTAAKPPPPPAVGGLWDDRK